MEKTEFLEGVLVRLRTVKHSDLPEVARGSGVPESTIRKIRYGEVKDPRVQTVQALRNYFDSPAAVADPTVQRQVV